MARIRSIKPEFWTDEKVVSLSPLARLLFIGLWNFADDEGRGEYSPVRMKMQILPADTVEVSELVGEIRREGLVVVYEIEGKQYFQIKGFSKHQKVDKRASSKCPPPPPPANPPRVPPTEGIKEGIKEGKGEGSERGSADAPPTGFAFVGRVIRLKQSDFDKWRKAYHHIPDMIAELTKADDYYSENPPKDGKWFFPVSNWLEKAHEAALKAKSNRDDETYRNVL